VHLDCDIPPLSFPRKWSVAVPIKLPVGKHLLGLDVLAWTTAIILGTLVYYGFWLARIEPWRMLLLVGLAAVLQVGVGLIHGLYTGRRRYQAPLNEVGAVAGAAAATTTFLVVINLWLIPWFVPLGVIIAGGLVALGLMGASRYVLGFNAQRCKQRRRAKRLMQIPLDQALALAEGVIAGLAACDAVLRCSYVGSLRGMRETVNDIDLVAASERPAEVFGAFLSLRQVHRVVKEGATKVAVVTREGIQIELTVVPPGAYAAALVSKSGARAHNNRLRKLALRRGYRLAWRPRRVAEYWLFLLTTAGRVPAEREETEEQIYERLGMQWIPPTLREDRGEIEAALKGRLPRLVELTDIRGDLHSHSVCSDGLSGMQELAVAAAERGYEYYAITDRGRGFGWDALELEAIERQREEIRTLNANLKGRIVVLNGVELNIGPDGELDYPDEILKGLDLVVACLHDDMDQDRDRITNRLLRAIEHPRVHIIGHPTGRRIGRREPYGFDFDEICQAATRHRVVLEINARPDRLDLPDEYVRRAKDYGVRFAVSTGARSPGDLTHMRFGVATAQRGWATAEDVINTWPLERLKRFLTKPEAEDSLMLEKI
jgi:DNA polymerase (family 10)